MTDEPRHDHEVPDRRAGRVAVVHRQTRPTLLLALGFTAAAAVSAPLPTITGRWVPLHLFFVGGLLLAVSGATQLLSVTWSTSIPPPDAVVRWQRLLLAAGAVGVVLGRELSLPDAVVVVAGAVVIAALLMVIGLLAGIRATATTPRFLPAIDGYVGALVAGVAGTGFGLARAVDAWPDRAVALGQAHMVVNVYGLVGVVIAATLPFFVATQIRSKMWSRASGTAIRTVLVGLAAATGLASAGALLDRSDLTAIGLGAYAVGLVATIWLCPRPNRRQLRWAGPRIWLLASGMVWWVGATVALGVGAGRGEALGRTGLAVVAVGGFVPIVLGSLAYFGPVLRGGGHERLAEGFRLTRSWLAVGACNVAAVGLVAAQPRVAVLALGVLAVDVAVRVVLLVR